MHDINPTVISSQCLLRTSLQSNRIFHLPFQGYTEHYVVANDVYQTVGVRQGDNMAPILFLFLMTAFAETLEIVWKDQDIPTLSVMTATDERLAEGKICSHTPAMFRSKNLSSYEILQCLYVDDGAFPFGTREDLQRGMELIYHHFARFGLEMHIGRGSQCPIDPTLR